LIDPLNDGDDAALESIFNDLIEGNEKGRAPPSSVEEMGQLIMSVVTGLLDQLKVELDEHGRSLESTLQIFKNSINYVVSSFHSFELFYGVIS